jgi:hypothetical protein
MTLGTTNAIGRKARDFVIEQPIDGRCSFRPWPVSAISLLQKVRGVCSEWASSARLSLCHDAVDGRLHVGTVIADKHH